MRIIDSLLRFIFFSLERCRRTSLFFGSVKHKKQWHGQRPLLLQHSFDPSYS